MILLVLFALILIVLLFRFRLGKLRSEQYWRQSCVQEISGLGATGSLEILPLIDWYTSDKNFMFEAGVSYLIRTDEKTILFDVGYNPNQMDPSPLLRNMHSLGITPDDLDIVFISHNHPDHVGGMKFMRRKSFSLTSHQIPLGNKAVYTPIPMTYPQLDPICVENPTVIAKGVTSIGAIPTQLFFLGWTAEQALACHVDGKGIVLIIGCGHQTLPKIIERTEALFSERIYGIVGGLHYPVSGGREKVLGIPIEKYVGTGKVPWRPVTMDEVSQNIQLLQARKPHVVALSAHDSCDTSLSAFREAFPNAYKDIRVGESIVI
jgi:7,8-dihydropterin-6-yl-methyl-4-(beta-D-ribofuranosyl)aminobenzene 5'-phosphate synthase